MSEAKSPTLSVVTFTYLNHRGQIAQRRVVPTSIDYVPVPGFGYQAGWFLTGFDLDKNATRSFKFDRIVEPDGETFHFMRLNLEVAP